MRSRSLRTADPIVLMPDHATVGGYPVACCVITADLPVLGQLRPGDTVSFTAVDPGPPGDARQRWERVARRAGLGMVPDGGGDLTPVTPAGRSSHRGCGLPEWDRGRRDAGNHPPSHP